MYAIVFDLDTQVLQDTYRNASWNYAYTDVRRILEQRGFEWQQARPTWETIASPRWIALAVQQLKREYEWFGPAVRDIRMLRIDENNDLSPALD